LIFLSAQIQRRLQITQIRKKGGINESVF
jgi:hypothetical protein